MEANELQEFKDKFDAMLAETTDEELFEFFEERRLERLANLRLPTGYRFLIHDEPSQIGDLYADNGTWVLYEGCQYKWQDTDDFKMIRLYDVH